MNYEQFKYDRTLYKRIIALEKQVELPSSEREYRAGEYIWHHHQKQTKIGMLKSGVAKASTISESGKEISDGFYFVGDFVPAFLMFTEQKELPYDLVAKKETLIVWYELTEFYQYLVSYPATLLDFSSYIAYRSVYDKFLLRCMNYKHVDERLAYWLIQSYQIANNNVNIPYSQEILAENLFVTRSTLNTELKKFEKAGYIKLEGKMITILQIAELRSLT